MYIKSDIFTRKISEKIHVENVLFKLFIKNLPFCSTSFICKPKQGLIHCLKNKYLSTPIDGLVWTGTYIKSMKYKSGAFTIRRSSTFVICVCFRKDP